MIKYVEGDILLSEAKAIAHGIAPNDDFKSGLAMSLRERWPAMYKDMRHFCHEASPKPGTIWTWAGVNAPRIVNLFTQEPPMNHGAHPGPAHLEYVNHALKALREWVTAEKIPTLALPRLSTGVGKLKWEQVQPLIEKHLGDLNISVYVYSTYKMGIKAVES
jgi:O-acetyl-ADP-ribose deacetylase (regulator of RNase III)